MDREERGNLVAMEESLTAASLQLGNVNTVFQEYGAKSLDLKADYGDVITRIEKVRLQAYFLKMYVSDIFVFYLYVYRRYPVGIYNHISHNASLFPRWGDSRSSNCKYPKFYIKRNLSPYLA